MSNEYERQNRLAEALNIRGLKAVELAEKTKLSKSSVSHWLNQHWQPKQRALVKMAKVLDVSEMWLAGYDVPMDRPLEQKNIDELTQLINRIRKNDKLKSVCMDVSELDDNQLNTISVMIKEIKHLATRD